jgi:hypothetical protein
VTLTICKVCHHWSDDHSFKDGKIVCTKCPNGICGDGVPGWEKLPPKEAAVALGHDLEWDPPHELSRFGRYTCTKCGKAVLIRPNGSGYGSATRDACD